MIYINWFLIVALILAIGYFLHPFPLWAVMLAIGILAPAIRWSFRQIKGAA